MLTADEARAILAYDPETGVFTWKVAPARWKKAGTPAGSWKKGYLRIGWNGVTYSATHLAFLIQTGIWPADEVDHVNGTPSDNRWCNLREATSQQQKQNRRVRKDSGTGVKGVAPHPDGRFRVKIRHEGKSHHVGLYATMDEAKAAYQAAADRMHGEFNQPRA